MRRNANSYENQIVSKVSLALNSMTSMTLDAANKLDNMKTIIDRIQNLLGREDL